MEIGHGPTELPLGLYEWCFDAQTRELVVQGGHMTKLYSLPFHTAVRLDFKDHVSSLIPVGDSLYAFIGAMPHSGKTTEPFLSFYDRKGTLIKKVLIGRYSNLRLGGSFFGEFLRWGHTFEALPYEVLSHILYGSKI